MQPRYKTDYQEVEMCGDDGVVVQHISQTDGAIFSVLLALVKNLNKPDINRLEPTRKMHEMSKKRAQHAV